MILGNATADSQMPYTGGLKVALGCEWCRRSIGECNCRFLEESAEK